MRHTYFLNINDYTITYLSHRNVGILLFVLSVNKQLNLMEILQIITCYNSTTL